MPVILLATITPITFREESLVSDAKNRLIVDIELTVISELTVSVLRLNVDNVPVALDVKTIIVE